MCDMRLTAMAEAMRHQLSDSSLGSLSFEERVGLVFGKYKIKQFGT